MRPMSNPTQTTTPQPETGFDPLAFWILHRQKIVLFAGVFVVLLAILALAGRRGAATRRRLDEHAVTVAAPTVEVRATNGPATLPELLRALDAAGICTLAAEVIIRNFSSFSRLASRS